VSRRPNPENRRSSLLGLTAVGRRLLNAATSTFESELRVWLGDPLTARSLEVFASTLARLRRTMEDARAGMPTG
jgi:MarR family multiple antibiotic resistance transcriptional regulator